MGSHVCDGDFNLHTRLDRNRCDLLDDVRRRVQIDQTLVDAHFKAIKGVGSLSTWTFADAQTQLLCWQSHWTCYVKVLILGTLDEISTDLLQGLDVATCEGNADAVKLLLLSFDCLGWFRHASKSNK